MQLCNILVLVCVYSPARLLSYSQSSGKKYAESRRRRRDCHGKRTQGIGSHWNKKGSHSYQGIILSFTVFLMAVLHTVLKKISLVLQSMVTGLQLWFYAETSLVNCPITISSWYVVDIDVILDDCPERLPN